LSTLIVADPIAMVATNPELRSALRQTYQRYQISQHPRHNFSFEEFVERSWNNTLPFAGDVGDLLWILESDIYRDFMEPSIRAEVEAKLWD